VSKIRKNKVKKNSDFSLEGVFFFLTCPLMGDPYFDPYLFMTPIYS
jgi:hypothetical protein